MTFRPVPFTAVLAAIIGAVAPSGFAQARYKPLVPVAMLDDLPCAANIVGGNDPKGMYPPQAIGEARRVLWDHFVHGAPSFLNLELASKEGAVTRIVYILERPANDKPLVIRWAMQRQLIDFTKHSAKWQPAEDFQATDITRDQGTGELTFKNGDVAIGHL